MAYDYQPMGSYKAYREPLPRKVAQLFSDLAEFRANKDKGNPYPGVDDPRNFDQRTYFTELQALEDYYYNLTPKEQNEMLLHNGESFGKKFFGPQEFQGYLQSKAPVKPLNERMAETPMPNVPTPTSYEEAQSLIGRGTFQGSGDSTPRPIAYGRGMGSSQALSRMGLDVMPSGGPIMSPADIDTRLEGLLQSQQTRKQRAEARENQFKRKEAGVTAKMPFEEQKIYQEGTVYTPPEKTPQGYAANVEAEALGFKTKEKSLQAALKADQQRQKLNKEQQEITDNTNTAIDVAASEIKNLSTPSAKLDLLKRIKDVYGKDLNFAAVQSAINRMVSDYEKARKEKKGVITIDGSAYYVKPEETPETPETPVKEQQGGITQEEIRGFIDNGATVEEVRTALKDDGYNDDEIDMLLAGVQ